MNLKNSDSEFDASAILAQALASASCYLSFDSWACLTHSNTNKLYGEDAI